MPSKNREPAAVAHAVLVGILAFTIPAVAQDCSAKCTCPCVADTTKCTPLCATGAPFCRDSFCGSALEASCCCRAAGRPVNRNNCAFYDCGPWPDYQCAKLCLPEAAGRGGIAPAKATGNRASTLTRTSDGAAALSLESCTQLQQDFKPDQDLWSYSELVESKQAGVPVRQLRFASDPDYATKFQECADHQLMFGGEDDAATSFHFRQARWKKDANGRLFGLKVPEGRLGKLSGVLAVQLTMSRSGQVLGKKLLFTTNTALGDEVLAAITDWITVQSPGTDFGPFEDLLYLDFEAGALSMGSQSHYIQTPADGGRRPVS